MWLMKKKISVNMTVTFTWPEAAGVFKVPPLPQYNKHYIILKYWAHKHTKGKMLIVVM